VSANLNFQSTQNTKTLYQVHASDHPDIVFFTETHLDKLVLDKNIHFSGYDSPVRKDRNSDGGGIIMYYKTHVNIKRRVDLENTLACR
jgi:exonuclease III